VRYPWGDFPDVVRNGNPGELKSQPEYADAKAGDEKAAFAMALRLLRKEFIQGLLQLAEGCRHPVLLPVMASEQAGNNKIPAVFSAVISDIVGWPVEDGVYQVTKAYRTGSGADHRLAVHPEFDGQLTSDADYIIIDDTMTTGGTLADLRGFVQEQGGKVIGMAALVAHPGAVGIAIKPGMLADILARHPPQDASLGMDDFWRAEYGHGIACLTQGEAGHLRAARSVDAIRDRLLTARHAHLHRLGAAGGRPAESAGSLPDHSEERERASSQPAGHSQPAGGAPRQGITSRHLVLPPEGPRHSADPLQAANPSQRNPATILSDAIRTGGGDNRMIHFAANCIHKTGEKLWAGTATTHDLSCLTNAVTSPSNLSAAERGGLDKAQIAELLTHIGTEVASLLTPDGPASGEPSAQAIFAAARESAMQTRFGRTIVSAMG
jgi:hypothetical protein